MTGLITMDDLTNEEILDILDDAERLLPVAKGGIIPPIIARPNYGQPVFRTQHTNTDVL